MRNKNKRNRTYPPVWGELESRRYKRDGQREREKKENM